MPVADKWYASIITCSKEVLRDVRTLQKFSLFECATSYLLIADFWSVSVMSVGGGMEQSLTSGGSVHAVVEKCWK